MQHLPGRRNDTQMRILIVAVHFPPANSVASLRPYSWARFLSRKGHDVSVLTTHKPELSLSPDTGARGDIELIEVPLPGSHWVRSADKLTTDAPTSDHLHSLFAWRNLLRRLLYRLRRVRGILSSARMPDHHDLWVLPALWRIRRRNWDVVLSTHGPYACHLVGFALRKSGKTKHWIADFRDLWVDNHIFPGIWPFTAVERWLEALVCGTADHLSTVSEGLEAKLRGQYGDKVSVIENGIDMEDLVRLPAQRIFPDDGKFRLVYTGTVYAAGQDPEVLFRAISMLARRNPAACARLSVVFAGKFQSGVEDFVTRYQLGAYVRQTGVVDRDDALRMQRDADALLFLSFHSSGHAGILTGKLFEYLASGTEILSVGQARDPDTAQLIDGSRRGRDYGGDSDALAAALERLLEHGSEGKFVDLATRARVDRSRANDKLLALLLKLSQGLDDG